MTPTDTRSEAALASILEADTLPEDKHWRMTGELPKTGEEAAASHEVEEKEVPEVPPTTDDAASSEEPGDISAAPPAAPPQKESKSEKRWKELSERVGARERENETLRRRLEELERRPASEQRETAAPQPALVKTEPVKVSARPKLADIDKKTGKPFATIADWESAVDSWDEDRDKRIQSSIDERLSKAEQGRTNAEQQRQLVQEVSARMQPARDKYSDYEQVAGNPELPIMSGSAVDLYIQRSKIPGEVAYYLGKHPEILAEFFGLGHDPATNKWDYRDFDIKTGKYTNHVDPVDQIIRLTEIERQLSSSPSVRSATPNPPARRVTNAPRPPHDISARASTTVDPVEEAVKANDGDGDFDAYKVRQNARDIARRKGR